jgi:hypothetical protein
VAAVVGEGAPPPMLDGVLCPICCGEVHPRPEAEVAVVQVHLVAVGGCGAGVTGVVGGRTGGGRGTINAAGIPTGVEDAAGNTDGSGAGGQQLPSLR